MSRFQNKLLWIKNLLKINNVYDCARPFLALFGLFGTGATRICHTEGVYSMQNTRFSVLVTCAVMFYLPFFVYKYLMLLFHGKPRPLYLSIYRIIDFITMSLRLLTMATACIMTHIARQHLDRVFQIIHNIDCQLEGVNIRVKHWQITLKVTVLALITADYTELIDDLYVAVMTLLIRRSFNGVLLMILVLSVISIHLIFMWVVLFLLIIQERFVCVSKVLKQNATVINIQIVGARNLRDNYMLRRISLARHVHEQLAEVVQLFSDTCRYAVIILLVMPIIEILYSLLTALSHGIDFGRNIFSILTHFSRVVVLLFICQANQSERRARNGRLRHLVAFETNRNIILQVQQYIMYNAYSVKGIIDFQFTDMDNVLLFTMIDIIISNMLIIYSYFR